MFGTQQFEMKVVNQPESKCLSLLEELLARVKKTCQSKADQQFLHKYRLNFEITQPGLLVGGELKKYQLEALQWMINLASQNSNGILADDMGLGKTIQTISYFAYLKEEQGILGKHLIVCPKSVAGNWDRQIKKWFPSAKVALMITNCDTRQKFYQEVLKPRKFDILITNYQGARISASKLSRIKWETMTIDQAQKIKNNLSQNFNILNEMKASFRLLLTGTPLNNNLQQLWALLNFIMPDIFSDERLFIQIQEYTSVFNGTEEEKLQFQCRIAKFFHEIINPFFKRRTKKQLDLGLPEKEQMTLFVPLSKLQLRLYRNFLKFGNIEGDIDKVSNFNIMTPRKICQHPYLFHQIIPQDYESNSQTLMESSGKLNVLDKLLKKLIAEKHKVLIFSQFVIMLEILEDYCDYKGYKYCKIEGNSSLQERDQSISKFYKEQKYCIFLLSTRAGGLGLNLVAADRVIIYDIDWNPQSDNQAMDRAYRIGQTKKVVVYKLITQHSIEQRMLQMQKYKLIWDELVIQKGAVFGRKKEDPFKDVNINHLSKLGSGQIFHLEQEENDQSIQQILALGEQKNKIKQDEIRQKLKKTLEEGSRLNPFKDIQQVDEEDLTNYNEQDMLIKRRNYENDKRLKAKFERNMILPPYKFYIQPQLIKDIEFQIHMEAKRQNSNPKLLQHLYQQLQEAKQKGRFHNWAEHQFEKFIQAHQYYRKNQYSKMAEFIQSKTQQQVYLYSQYFYQKAPNNQRLAKYIKQIQIYQSKLKKNENISGKSDVKRICQKQQQQSEAHSAETQDKQDKNFKSKEEQKIADRQEKKKIYQQQKEKARLLKQKARLQRLQSARLRQEAKILKQQQKKRRDQQRAKRIIRKQQQYQLRQRKKLEQQRKKKEQQAEKIKKQMEKLVNKIEKEQNSSKKAEKLSKTTADEKEQQAQGKEAEDESVDKLDIVQVICD